MRVAIIGLPNSGKSTVFNVLTRSNIETGNYASAKQAPNIAVVKVPDLRVEKLNDIFKPEKKTPAEIIFEDYIGVTKDSNKKQQPAFSEQVKQADALVHVCRVFDDESVPHHSDKIDPIKDAEIIELELIMADLTIIENRIERLQKDISRKKTTELTLELELMQKLKQSLEAETPIRQLDLSAEEKKIIRGYCFLSQKPIIILANLGEDQLLNPPIKEIEDFSKKISAEFQALSGKLEMEISQMAEAEQQEFLKEYGITASARDIFIRKAYDMLGLISFFTVGEDEVKAWTITRGTDAPNAAGTIHTDLQRGFIRAETVSYKDFIEVGTLAKAREKGLLRQEGKTYIVQDGDIINIKFNV